MRQDTLLRRQAMLDYDTAMRTQFGVICGVDEAGRGPLAGDVYAAAVILDENHGIVGLDDSKKLSEKRRETLYDEITEKAVAWCIATATVAEIEKLNILQAAMLAMRRAVAGLGVQPAYVLVDGNRLPELNVPGETVVKGDATSASIAAASVLAKVARDRYMLEQAAHYPQYAFEKHKGYGTAEHRAALLQYGACPIHRPSFLKKILS
ncbi:MAG: ribonuclease HII [Oscillospiraceae bacterium]|nr:ribonuclease HII [Oscillospiraceae bacterium]